MWGLGSRARAAAVVAAAIATAGSFVDRADAATCTAEQKQARTAALAQYQRQLAPARAAYFRKQKSPKARAAFVRAQQKKLRSLRAAAACSVPPLPPSSSASCSFQLAPHPDVERFRFSFPVLHGGPIDPLPFMPSIGHVEGVLIFVDFPDSPGDADPAGLVAQHTTDIRWFGEASYGRFSMAMSAVPRWVRMPLPMASYQPPNASMYDYAAAALRAADPFVDFSRYQYVTFLNPRGWPTNQALMRPVGYGTRVDGVEIRFGNTFGPDIRRFGTGASWTLNHEILHTMGLPDLGGRALDWDPMSYGTAAPTPAHLFGWHKWLLRWLDPPQLTCLTAPGTLEETLTPIAVAGGKKIVVVPVTASYAYVVEARRRIGFDSHACEEGVVIYSVDSQRTGNDNAIVMRGPVRCGLIASGAFRTGTSFEDEHVKVEVLASDGRDYRVRVTKK
jgi:M6 family metalloprotease-like protein